MSAFQYTNSKGVTYYLNKMVVVLRNGIQSSIYFFSRDVRTATQLEVLPEGMEVMEVEKTKMPLLRRKK